MKSYEGVGTPGYSFEFTGGHVAVDFANTVGNRNTSSPVELLPAYASLASWAEQAKLLTWGAAARLKQDAARRPADAEVSRIRALALRDALFLIFTALATGRPAPPEPLAVLNAFLAEALGRRRVRRQGRRLVWGRADEGSLDSVFWPIAEAAADLTTSPRRMRVKRCAAEDCRWLLLDTSRNQRRRWCDMTLCGNRAKNRRYYHRQKGSTGSAAPRRAGRARAASFPSS